MAYSADDDPAANTALWEHFTQPRHAGAFAPGETGVGSALLGDPRDGDVIQLQIRAGHDGRISATRFRAYGSVAAIAAASWVAEWATGRTLEEVADLDDARISAALALPPLQIQAAVLAQRALQAAVADRYRTISNHPEPSSNPCD